MNCKYKPRTPIKDHTLTWSDIWLKVMNSRSKLILKGRWSSSLYQKSSFHEDEFWPTRKEFDFEGVEEVIPSFCTYEQRREYWGKTWLTQELLQNLIMGKGRRSSKRQVKKNSIPSSYRKIKEKEKVNTKKAKWFSCKDVGYFKRIVRLT